MTLYDILNRAEPIRNSYRVEFNFLLPSGLTLNRSHERQGGGGRQGGNAKKNLKGSLRITEDPPILYGSGVSVCGSAAIGPCLLVRLGNTCMKWLICRFGSNCMTTLMYHRISFKVNSPLRIKLPIRTSPIHFNPFQCISSSLNQIGPLECALEVISSLSLSHHRAKHF